MVKESRASGTLVVARDCVADPHQSEESVRPGAEAPDQATFRHYLASRTERAFEDVCRLQIPRLLRYFEGRGCQPAQAEDLTQDVLLAVFRGTDALREAKAFHGWIFGIARNLLLLHWRRRGSSGHEVSLDVLESPPASEPVEPAELSARFIEWMNYLEPEERKVMRLRFVDDLDYQEIATTLDIPLGTVKWRIYNSRVKLLKHFGPKGDGAC
jgi:RNA polymerase sigma-70 factor (ECF subfamily)